MDRKTSAELTLAVFLLWWGCRAEEDPGALSCPEHQEGFDGSCYEFVALQQSFQSAEGWCEQGGGHLAFILNDETQQFLQKHLEPDKNWWLGVAPAAPNLTLDSAATEGKKGLIFFVNAHAFQCYYIERLENNPRQKVHEITALSL